METIKQKFKNKFRGKMKKVLWFAAVLLFGALMYYILMFVLTPFGPMSRFPAAILLMYIGVAAWVFFDKVYFSDIDTMQALREGNKAYAIMLLAIAVIIAAVISTV